MFTSTFFTFSLSQLMRRVVLLVGVLTSLLFYGCGEPPTYHLGLYLDDPSASSKLEGLKDGLKALGYSDGTSIQYHLLKSTELSPQQKTNKLSEFVANNYQAYWTDSNNGAFLLKQANLKKPLIVAGLTNPVQSGLVKSYYFPDTTLSGVDSLNTELTINRLNLLLTFDPNLRKVYLLYDSSSQAEVSYLDTLRAQASRLGVSLLEKPISTKEEATTVLNQLKASEARAILTIGGTLIDEKLDPTLLQTVITSQKLVLVGAERSDLDKGALFSYGGNHFALGHQSAAYVDKVLHELTPAQLPLLQPLRLELVLNQKIATQLGWKFEAQTLATADEIIS